MRNPCTVCPGVVETMSERQPGIPKNWAISFALQPLAKQAAQKQWTHVHYLAELAAAEANLRQDRTTERRIRMARFPQIKTLEQFKWNWPKKINQMQVQDLFRINFVKEKSNVVFLGGVGLGNYRKFLFMERL